MFAEAPVWHYWIGVAVAALVVVATIAVVTMYVRKTQGPRYPGDR